MFQIKAFNFIENVRQNIQYSGHGYEYIQDEHDLFAEPLTPITNCKETIQLRERRWNQAPENQALIDT